MTSSKTLGLCLLAACVLGTESIPAYLPSAVSSHPAPSLQHLLVAVQGLVRGMAEMKTGRERDRSRPRHVQRSSQELGGDVMVTRADIVLLRQYIGEMNSTLGHLDAGISSLQTQIAHVTSSQQKLEDEVRKLKHSRLQRSKLTGEKAASEADGSGARKNDFPRDWRSVKDRGAGLVKAADKRRAVPDSDERHLAVVRTPPVESLAEQRSDRVRRVALNDEAHQVVHSVGHTQEEMDPDPGTSGGGDEIHIEASGDDLDKYVIVGETFVPVPGPLANLQNHASSMTHAPYREHTATTTHHATSEIHRVLTHSTLSDPFVLSLVSLLHQRLNDVELRLNVSALAGDVTAALANESARLDSEMLRHVGSIRKLEGEISELNGTVSRLASQTPRSQLEKFVDVLQASLANFSSRVANLEQRCVASTQLMAVAQRTGERLNSLTSRVRDSRKLTGRLQSAARAQRLLSEQQFHLLQMYVIQLNNSVQDLREQVDRTMQPSQRHMNDVDNLASSGAEDRTLVTRLDDLALQLLYSDNRLSHLEVKVLNASLASCQKASNDMHQDAAIQRINQIVTNTLSDNVVLRETVKRLDLNLHRLHGNDKAIREDIRRIQGQVKTTEGLPDAVQLVRKEVNNLLFQLPADCHEYYERGFYRTGDYVISPKVGARSTKVRCVMITLQKNIQHEGENTSLEDSTALDLNGGWTVIQQRQSGKVSFNRTWAEYADGFGTTDSEYWIGNDLLHLMTSSRNYSLRVSMRDVSGRYWGATYRLFAVSSKEDNYRLSLGRYRGNATDSFNYSSGMTFSTYDRDTDASSMQCARFNGGWWYRHCQISNLNGPYDMGMIWFHRQQQDWLQLREVVMTVRGLS